MRKMQLVSLARGLRHNQTEAEMQLWAKLRDEQVNGVKFRRQHPIGNYVVDFVSLDMMLVIELDGGQHKRLPVRKQDEQRTMWLEGEGFHVIRFWDNDVLLNIEGVLARIQEVLAELSPSPYLSPQGRGNY